MVKLVPGLEIASVSGKWNNFTLKQVRYQRPDLTVEVSEFQLAIDFSSLLHRKLCIDVLSLRNVSVQVKKKSPSLLKAVLAIANTEQSSWKYISIPSSLSLMIRCLTLHNMQVKLNNINIQLHDLHTGLIFRDTKLVLQSTFLSGLLVVWPKTAFITPNTWINVAKLNTLDQYCDYKILLNLLTKLLLRFTLPFEIALEEINGRDLHFAGSKDIWISKLYIQSKTANKSSEITQQLIGHINSQPQQVLVDLNARALHWGNINIKNFSLRGKILSGNNINSNLCLQWYTLQQGKWQRRELMLTTTGNKKQHKIIISLQGKRLVSGKVQIQGLLDTEHQLWHGKISKTSLVTPTGVWQLTKDVILDYSYQDNHQKITISSHSWENNNSYIYIPNKIEVGVLGNIKVQLTNFDLSMLKFLLPTTMKTSVLITGLIDLHWKNDNELPYTKITLVGNKVKLINIQQKKNWHVLFDTFIFKTGLDKHQAYLDWALKIAGNGECNGKLQIKDPKQKCNINGNITIKNLSLVLLKPLIELKYYFDDPIEGIINAGLSISGNVKSPLIYGEVRIDRLVIQNNIIPLSMTESRLIIYCNGTRSDLQGFIGTTHGQIYLNGYADWCNLHTWHIYVTLKGNKIRIYMPSMRFDVSPNIIFEAKPNLLTLNGQVNIPWMRIKVKEWQQTTADISLDDAILLDEQLNLIPMLTNYKRIIALPIVTNLLLHLNNDVQINAFGLTANLLGNLQITKSKNRPLSMNGEIKIPYGYYHAYNKDLIIKKGSLLFSDEIDKPDINIEAIRDPNTTEDNIITGVRVTGKIQSPKLEIFSNPVKSQQEALSYLLNGHGIDTVNAYDQLVTSMFISMGTTRNQYILNKIGKILCLHQITFNINEDQGHYQFLVSGYILPKLRLTSIFSTMNLIMTISARHYFIPNVNWETIINDKQTINLNYQFDFD
ncbi:translocation/assembly module TamB domain-containing protein [Candidatus Palibaumannia cicadellinicola]|uniref:translocation/assembly module TamB domain-containing protein n=1 Tax=Candidatus Palibaumannia cicadellinicola TaxID=186490 RepID=UPI00059FE51D|nr:translocation/assembly module TamB domain-containing protein [Candidatus Baumannia cicadellinicola]MCJ7461949.1 translocation/assembly module TamB domain-containing protein [Candidatus Baumannia cicadellinicola]MCJ7462535.1 translocation/assembly module TamB domain-containing protein [Candidatus Baumannia cicadellinicola]